MRFEYSFTAVTRFLYEHDQLIPFLVAAGIIVIFVLGIGYVGMWLHTYWVYHRMIRERKKECSKIR